MNLVQWVGSIEQTKLIDPTPAAEDNYSAQYPVTVRRVVDSFWSQSNLVPPKEKSGAQPNACTSKQVRRSSRRAPRSRLEPRRGKLALLIDSSSHFLQFISHF
jgi:hypothetical protein